MDKYTFLGIPKSTRLAILAKAKCLAYKMSSVKDLLVDFWSAHTIWAAHRPTLCFASAL